MDQRLDRIEKRLDSIDANLEKHMKRSDQLEAQVLPMHAALLEFKGAIKFVKFVGVLIGIAEAIHLWL